MVLKIFLLSAIVLTGTFGPPTLAIQNISQSYNRKYNICSSSNSPIEGVSQLPSIEDWYLFNHLEDLNMITWSLAKELYSEYTFPIARFNPKSNLYEFKKIPPGGHLDDIDYREFPQWFCAADTIEKVRFTGSVQLYTCHAKKAITTTAYNNKAFLECSWTCEPDINNATMTHDELQPAKRTDSNFCIDSNGYNKTMTPITNTDQFLGLSPRELIILLKQKGVIPENSAAERYIPYYTPLLRLVLRDYVSVYQLESVQYTFANGTFGGPEKINYRDFPAWMCAPSTIERVRIFKESEKLSTCRAFETVIATRVGKFKGNLLVKCVWICDSVHMPPKDSGMTGLDLAFEMVPFILLLHFINHLQ